MKLLASLSARRNRRDSGVLEPVDRPWTTGLVLVCQECDGGPAKPVDVLKEAKAVTRLLGPKKRTRVTGSGCLDVCPKEGVAIAVCVDGGVSRCLVAHNVSSLQQLSEVLW
jgi:hypothetical protein